MFVQCTRKSTSTNSAMDLNFNSEIIKLIAKTTNVSNEVRGFIKSNLFQNLSSKYIGEKFDGFLVTIKDIGKYQNFFSPLNDFVSFNCMNLMVPFFL